jgi:hypothetical protein
MSHLVRFRAALVIGAALCSAGCTFVSTATHWNGIVGHDGKPIFVKEATNLGMNFLVAIPLVGNLTIDQLIDKATSEIAVQKGDHVRVVQSISNNGWNGLVPITFFFTPVVTSISIEYEPSAEELEKARRQQAGESGR